MSFLTRVPVHQLVRRGQHFPDSPEDRHHAVMSLFGQIGGPESAARAEEQILFRIEQSAGAPPFYLIRSAHVPDELEKWGISREGSVREEPRVEILPVGTPVRFRLAINAVQRPRTSSENGRPGRPLAIRPVRTDETPDDQLRPGETRMGPWLTERLAPALTHPEIFDHQREIVRGRSGGKTIQIDTVDGSAVIADPLALQALLEDGVGRAKAYGCGLLTILPVAAE